MKAIGAAGIAGLAGCSGGGSEGDGSGGSNATTTSGSSGGSDSSGVSAAFVYNAEVGDVGWTKAHDDGRQYIEDQFDWIETASTEAVAPGDAAGVFERYAQDGYDAIFGCTFGFMDPMYSVAPDYPDTYFEHCSGYQTRENMGRYYGRLYQSRYLTGVAAGMLTESNTLGYVGSFPIAEVIRQLNAFALGAASVNSEVTMKVRWLNSWMDPPQATQAVNALVDAGADVINNHLSSAASVRTAAENDAWGFTYNTPMPEQGGDYYGGSAVFDWGQFYAPTVESIYNDEWESDAYWGGLDEEVVGVDIGDTVPDDVASEVESVQSSIVAGDTDVWTGSQFEGWSDEELFGDVGSYAEPVEGEVPSSE